MHYGKKTVLFVGPLASSLMGHVDPETNEIVMTCAYCGAELRGSMATLTGHVTFKHELECPWLRELEEKNASRTKAASC
jgi:hypothetical protein